MTALLLPITLALASSPPLASEPAPSAFAALPAPSLALVEDMPEMEYTYVEANYIWTDLDEIDESVDGFELVGSLELPLNFFAQLAYSQQSDSADLDQYRIGAGYHLPLGSRFDVYGILSYANVEVDGSGSDFDEDGVAGELGLRVLLTDRIEVNGRAQWVNVDEDDYGAGVGARFYLMDRLSLGARVDVLEGDETFGAGVRFEL